MSQIPDIAPHAMAPAPAPRTRKPLPPVDAMSDGELADEHRGQTFAKMRAADRLKQIEAELIRRGLPAAQGKIGVVTKQFADIGLLDLDRLKAELGPDICREYAIAGSNVFWRSRTLGEEERCP